MKIILSNSNNEAYKVAMEQLKKDYHNGSKQIIIAPDRYVVSLEATTMNDLEKNEGYVAAMNVEHMSFERLGERLLGNEVGKCLTKEGAVMLLANVIEENKGKLQYYKRSIKKEGFAAQIYDVITQLRNSGASTEDVETMIEKLAPALHSRTQTNSEGPVTLSYRRSNIQKSKRQCYTFGHTFLPAHLWVSEENSCSIIRYRKWSTES